MAALGPRPGQEGDILSRRLSRRDALRALGLGAAAVGGAGVLDACSSASTANPAGNVTTPTAKAGKGVVRIGYVTPQTGPLADFSQSDPFVLGKVRATSPYAKGMTISGKKYDLEIVVVDSQSSVNRAATVTQQLIHSGIDLVVTSSAPETTNPVAAACEEGHVPCIATVVPWQSWYAGLGGDPLKPGKAFAYNTMFFFGLEEFAGTFLPMWNRVKAMTHADSIYGGMFPNDADGNAFREGFPPFAAKEGYHFVDGGAYTDGTTDYSSMIEKFKSHHCDFFVNAPLPPDFNTFWKQASQAGYKPKLATVAKVLLFPSDVTALGDLVVNIATDAWWTPFAPYSSSLTGQSAKGFATDYQNSTGREWVQSMGSAYSLFEVAVEGLKAVDDPHDKAQLAASLQKVKYNGLCVPIAFAEGPAPGVGIIKPVGIQWKKGGNVLGKSFPYHADVVDNSLNKDVPLTGDLQPTNA